MTITWLPRTGFDEQHDMFRQTVRTFCEREVAPHNEQWAADGQVSREVWLKAGETGLLCMAVPEEYGGVGVEDFRYNAIVNEELIRVGASGPGFSVHTDINLPYFLEYTTDVQKKTYLPKMVTGECITAIAMSEPGTGSDLSGIQTRAVRDGDEYVVNGSKIFISNGQMADVVITVVRTGEDPHKGLSLLLIDADTPGFQRGRNLDKMGMKAQDTSELFFDDCRVPAENLLGEEGAGFAYLVGNLPQERLSIATSAVAAAEAAFEETHAYITTRTAFNRAIGSFQNSRFVMAELRTEIELARTFIDRCLDEHAAGALSIEHAAMAKWWTTEMQLKVIDRCLQLHGGYGFMTEYPISRAYVDSRAQTIYGGTTEIMKEIVGRSMGL
ncbi:acyl-CoA dehydrogenase family protein [Euzebya tangerina]|uniref:acyl-CoA dehydrogenase family protein n=1 Tax=Euzebya tangerina TaxID=591198 RepID=UPI000E30B612|nr:acyl-CoA dehydrogenase family protein [Euzebya tangerina]